MLQDSDYFIMATIYGVSCILHMMLLFLYLLWNEIEFIVMLFFSQGPDNEKTTASKCCSLHGSCNSSS